jgi:hypothetical protein
MFEFCLHDEDIIFDGGWLVIAFYFLWQSLEFFFEGTRNPPAEKQGVNWVEYRHNHSTWAFPSVLSHVTGIIQHPGRNTGSPPTSVVGNVKTDFSGHYQRHGFNIQAIVDHLGRFLYIAVAAPGSQPDINAFNRTCLHSILSQLPLVFLYLETMRTSQVNISFQSSEVPTE